MAETQDDSQPADDNQPEIQLAGEKSVKPRRRHVLI